MRTLNKLDADDSIVAAIATVLLVCTLSLFGLNILRSAAVFVCSFFPVDESEYGMPYEPEPDSDYDWAASADKRLDEQRAEKLDLFKFLGYLFWNYRIDTPWR